MATLETKPTNGVSMGNKYTVTPTDISDGYVLFDFTTQYPIVAAIDLFSSVYARKNLAGSTITYPADGQVRFQFGAVGDEAEVTEITTVADTNRSLNGKYFTLNSPTVGYYVWYKETAVAEITDITTTADIARSLGGKYFTLNSPTIPYYVWYNTGTDVAEVTYIDTVADVSRSLGGKYFTLNSPTTAYYVWISTGYNVAQSVDVLTVADVASSLNSKYFTIDSPAHSYYVWFSVNGAGVDPLVAGKVGIELGIAVGATNVAVAQKIQTYIDMLDDFSATINGHTVTIVNAYTGLVTNAAAAGNSGFTVTTTVVGDQESTDPAVGGKTGIEVHISPGDANSAVATKIAAVLDPLDAFVASAGTNRVTITNTATGINTDATAATSTFSITVHIQGNSASVDPAVSGKTGIEVAIVPGETANNVASKTQAILFAMNTIFGCTVLNAVFTVTNKIAGIATDATTGTATTFTVNVTTQGANVGADPTVAGRTGVEVDISPGATNDAVALATQLILDAMTTIFDVTVLAHVFTVTNHIDGSATDAGVGTSGFTKNVTQQGANTSEAVAGDIITVVAFRDNA
jgi:hypothetical protein